MVKLPFRRELSDSEADSLAKACTEAENEASPSTDNPSPRVNIHKDNNLLNLESPDRYQ